MSDESSFEFINKKNDLGNVDNGKESGISSRGSWLTDVPPPTELPNFIPVSSAENTKESLFHPTTFSPAIPEAKAVGSDAHVQDLEESSGSLFDWVKDTVGNKGTTFLSKMAEKAKHSVDSVMNALDPQMGDLIAGKDYIDVVVASEKEIFVSSIREAFQTQFNRVLVRGLDSDDVLHAKQVVGFDAAMKICGLKANYLKNRYAVKGPVVVVQNFIVEVQDEKWYDLDLLALHDFERPLCLETYTQMTPIPYSVVNIIKEDTPKDYKEFDSGYSITVAQIMANNLQVLPSEWQETLTGVSRKDKLLMGAHALVALYKNTLP